MKKLTNESILTIEDIYLMENENIKEYNIKKITSKKRLLSAFNNNESINNRTYLIHNLNKIKV